MRRCSTRSPTAAATRRPSRSTTGSRRSRRRPRPASRSSPSGGRSRRSTATRRRTGRPIGRSRQDRHTLEITFTEPRDIATSAAAVQRPAGHGHRGRGQGPPVRRQAGLEHARAGSARRAHAAHPDRRRAQARRPDAGAGGIRELQIPGVEAREALRRRCWPSARCARDTGAGLTYLFQRTTGDDPFRRDPRARRRRAPRSCATGSTARRGITRVFSPPAARSWTLDGWVDAARARPRSTARRRRGRVRRPPRRFEGRPAFRASSAFDGTAQPWIGAWLDGRQAWLSWTTERDETVSTLRLDPVPGVRRPTQVRLNDSPPVAGRAPTAPSRLPQPVRGRAFRLDDPARRVPARHAGIDAAAARRRDRRGRDGGPTRRASRAAARSRDCFAAGTSASTSCAGGRGDDRGSRRRPSAARRRAASRSNCPPARRGSSCPAGALAPYLVRLRSARTAPGRRRRAASSTPGPRTAAAAATGIRLDLQAPARLVLAESYNRGRRASCDGEDLGEPEVGAGFGTAWRVPATCRERDDRVRAEPLVTAGYAVSLVVGVLLLALLDRDGAPPRRATSAALPERARPADAGAGARR